VGNRGSAWRVEGEVTYPVFEDEGLWFLDEMLNGLFVIVSWDLSV
jgi:hypothetical protein